ncbi:MAG: VWA domain-containing protein [Merismopedia sp. SIO2A8]|nr:VWA domain-containing protein [Merismopedia sp. SIO2A8]
MVNVEQARFTDGYIALDPNAAHLNCPGANVAILIDVSGSMSDDILAVKNSAASIIDTLFGTVDAPIASRLSIITFNDTNEYRTVLPFTDHASIADRRSAALAGIESVEILGGGDEPLNAALLSSLRGDAGSWDAGGSDNRIIVFTDEPAADPELRPEVTALATNILGNGAPQSTASDSSANNAFFEYFDSPVTETREPLPVTVSAVAIGSRASTLRDLQSLVDATGGQIFTAENAAQAAAALVDAIEAPPANAPQDALLVVGDTNTDSTSDAVLQTRLESLGFEVSIVEVIL